VKEELGCEDVWADNERVAQLNIEASHLAQQVSSRREEEEGGLVV